MKRRLSGLLAITLVLALSIGVLPGKALAAEGDYRYGTLEYFSKVTNDYVGDSFYFSDRWFLGDPGEENASLALVSAQLAATVTDDPSAGLAFLKALGFTAEAKRFDSKDAGDCAYIVGTRTISTKEGNKKLTAIAFQGAEYGDKGWQQNVTVNGDGTEGEEHASFRSAAQAFMKDYDKSGMGSSDILWITGQSRGGAVTNLAAAAILDRNDPPQVFAYAFESPAVTSAADAQSSKYKSIINYAADDDPVTMIPMWGMTRSGRDIVYNTESVEAVKKQLERMNPAAAEYAEEYNAEAFGGDVKGYLQGLVAGLAATVPAREDYSKVNTDRYVDEKGKTAAVSYTYQAGLQALCHIVFGGEGKDRLTSILTDMLSDLSGVAYGCLEEAYVKAKAPADSEALLADAAGRYMAVVGALYDAITEGSSGVSYKKEDLYALLKLLAPLLVDTGSVTGEDAVLPEYTDDIANEYIDIFKVVGLADGVKTLVFSHQPDMILARLKLAAPAPEMENVDLTAEQPKAGDPKDKAPGEVSGAVDARGESWLTLEEAGWLTEDKVLLDHKKYYLSVTLAAVGHRLPEGFLLTLNGEEPEDRKVEYKDGKVLVTGIWAFSMGTPETVRVSFDANGHGEAPETALVEAGSILKYAGLDPADPGIVKDEQGTWRFDGWVDENGTLWEEITANQDVTLRAKWVPLIDRIDLNYEIPFVGDSGEALFRVTAPEGAPYSLEEFDIINEHYNSLTILGPSDKPSLYFKIFMRSGNAEFLTENGEYGPEFAGVVTINGEEIEDLYYEDYTDGMTGIREVYLSVEYPFTPQRDPSHPSGFVDVPADSYFAGAVEWAVDNGITAGVSAVRFAPDQTCTRGQLVTFLWRAAGEPEPETAENPFEDVNEEDYYGEAVLWAVEQGITKGTDASHFSPADTVTRGQSVTFLYRMKGEPAEGENPFRDVSEDAYYYEPVLWAVEKGVTTGVSADRFAPGDNCTRAQVVTFLYRALGE